MKHLMIASMQTRSQEWELQCSPNDLLALKRVAVQSLLLKRKLLPSPAYAARASKRKTRVTSPTHGHMLGSGGCQHTAHTKNACNATSTAAHVRADHLMHSSRSPQPSIAYQT